MARVSNFYSYEVFLSPTSNFCYEIFLSPFNPLTPELNPSAQRSLPRIFIGNFNI